MIQRHTDIPSHIIAFCQYLRRHHFTVATIEERDSLLALSKHQAFTSPQQFKICLQTIFCKSQKDLIRFSAHFDHYWKELSKAVNNKVKDDLEQKPAPKKKQGPRIAQLKNWLYRTEDTQTIETALYSNEYSNSSTVKMNTDEQELQAIFDVVHKIVKRIATRRTRRFVQTHKRTKIDLRKSIRKNIFSSDELLNLSYRAKKKNLKVLILCDVSRSMEMYSRFFIQFMFAFKTLMQNSEIFVFGTKLHHITSELEHDNIDQSLHAIFQKVDDWSGGTRIGESLESFIEDYGQKLLTQKTVCFILSDGWDTGEADVIERSMDHIHKKSMKVIWLNPLMKDQDWKPEVIGMKKAMPYVDLLLPFHNIESMKSLINAL